MTLERVFPSDDGRSLDPAFSPENRSRVLEAIEQTTELCVRNSCTPAQLAVAWCHHQPGVTAAIVGARTPEQAVENARAASITLTSEQQARLSAAFDFRLDA